MGSLLSEGITACRAVSNIESGVRVEIAVDDVVGALSSLRPHRDRCVDTFKGEPSQPAHLPPPRAIVAPA